MKKLFSVSAIVALICGGLTVGDALAAGYGSVTGQVVLDGEIPKLKVKIAKGDAAVKDASCCAAADVANDELVVNPKNNGVENVFVYLKTVDKGAIHESLKKSKDAEVVFDQKGCKFNPHALIIRMDQTVVVKSDDPIQHNTHTYTILNSGQNVIVGANDRTGIKFPKFSQKERLPAEVKCDIHPWMRAWWLVVDHPYATITDADGKFSIEKLPEGDHKLVIWQERVGYVEKELTVKVKANGSTDLKQIKLPVAKVKIEPTELAK